MDTCDRVILISGAASGIGAAVARRLAGAGIGLVLHSGGTTPESSQRIEAVQLACETRGARCIVTHGDLAEPGHGAASVAAARHHFGRLDQILRAAGHVFKAPFGEPVPISTKRWH
jgi:3-oxoacyl-[acyl-carrier protein] reductase